MAQFFEQMWEMITGGTIYNLIILIFAIVSLAASFYFYKKSLRNTSATYAVRSISLINNSKSKLPAIDMLNRDNNISSLTITKFAIWNNGSDTINADSIAKNNTLRISVPTPHEIYGANIQYEKNPSNDFRIALSEDRRSVKVDFDYFDRDEGAVIQLYHSGRGGSKISLEGQIKSCGEIRRTKPYSAAPVPMPDFKLVELIRINNFEYRVSSYKAKVMYGWVIVAIAAVMLFLGLRDVWTEPAVAEVKDPFFESLWVIIYTTIYGFVGYQVVKRRIPKGFDIFNDEF